MSHEVNLRPFAELVTRAGHRVAIPKVVSDEVMNFYPWDPLRDNLIVGTFGILEPASHQQAMTPKSYDLCLIPCLGLDARGVRLGQGKGYYDRYLSLYPHGLRVGVLYEGQYLRDESLPLESHDVEMHMRCTQDGLFSFYLPPAVF